MSLLFFFFQSDAGAVAFVTIFTVIVSGALFYAMWKSSSGRQKKIAANPEEWYVTRSPGARKMIQQQIGARTVLEELSGVTQTHITVTEDTVYICEAIFGRVKTYPIDSISAVEVENIGVDTRLKIVMPGAVDRNNKENSIRFSYFDIPKERVQKVANTILEQRTKLKRGESPPANPDQSIPSLLKQLAALKESGVLSNEEFEAKKKELLSRM
jgi:hypothetical protein